jgi:hypothetical protein
VSYEGFRVGPSPNSNLPCRPRDLAWVFIDMKIASRKTYTRGS